MGRRGGAVPPIIRRLHATQELSEDALQQLLAAADSEPPMAATLAPPAPLTVPPRPARGPRRASHASSPEHRRFRALDVALPEAGAAAGAAAATSSADQTEARSSTLLPHPLLRLCAYALEECRCAFRLSQRLQTVAETIEMARVTGMTWDDVLHRAQMPRTWSLLQRFTRRHGYVLGGAPIPANLENGPYLIHPIDTRTAGFYRCDGAGRSVLSARLTPTLRPHHRPCRDPVAVLDFASLYPSVYMAYNLCYSTLLHPADHARLADRGAGGAVDVGRLVGPPRSEGAGAGEEVDEGGACGEGSRPSLVIDNRAPLDGGHAGGGGGVGSGGAGAAGMAALQAWEVVTCPSSLPRGSAFVPTRVREGLLPRILRLLVRARAQARAELAGLRARAGDSDGGEDLEARRSVLDARQKALKVCANALYGFTGAAASPLQCGPLAEACIHTGAVLCRAAKAHIERTWPEARVIYGQTDSLMVLLPGYTVAQACAWGRDAAEEVTRHIGRPPVRLAFERVLCPFLLLHVNRCAGALASRPRARNPRSTASRRRSRPATPVSRSTVPTRRARCWFGASRASAARLPPSFAACSRAPCTWCWWRGTRRARRRRWRSAFVGCWLASATCLSWCVCPRVPRVRMWAACDRGRRAQHAAGNVWPCR